MRTDISLTNAALTNVSLTAAISLRLWLTDALPSASLTDAALTALQLLIYITAPVRDTAGVTSVRADHRYGPAVSSATGAAVVSHKRSEMAAVKPVKL